MPSELDHIPVMVGFPADALPDPVPVPFGEAPDDLDLQPHRPTKRRKKLCITGTHSRATGEHGGGIHRRKPAAEIRRVVISDVGGHPAVDCPRLLQLARCG